VDLGSAAQEWQTHGFVVLPGFVPAAELEPALGELPAIYPTAEGFHDGTDERRDKFALDEWAGIESFPFRSAELSLLAVSDGVVDLAETLLADSDLRISSAEAWAKYTAPPTTTSSASRRPVTPTGPKPPSPARRNGTPG
jgi:hypothetical protein